MADTLPEALLPFAEPVQVLDQGFVRLVSVYGGEASILQAARVTSGSASKGAKEDRALLRYLMRHRHTTPFEFAEITLHVRVPMDAWRQWIRHRTANVNEYSTRYSEAIDAMAQTDAGAWRKQAAVNRQGSAGLVSEWPTGWKLAPAVGPNGEPPGAYYSEGERAVVTPDGECLRHAFHPGDYLSQREAQLQIFAREVYEERLAFGVAKEQARKDLPLSTYTEAYWKIDAGNLLHFLSLRLDEHAQLEIRLYAEAIAEIVKAWMPNVWEAFVDYRLDAWMLSGPEARAACLMIRGWLADEEEKARGEGESFDAVEYVSNLLPGLSQRELDAFLIRVTNG